MAKGEFKEVARVKTTDSTEIILSEIIKGKEVTAFALNPYITSERYTGYGKGFSIPSDMLSEFLAMFDETDLKMAIDMKGGQ